MNIAILSREPRNYSTKRLREAALQRGHKIRIMDTLKFGIYVEEESPDLTYNGKHFPVPDVIIPRIGSSITFFGAAVVRQFEQMGVFALNGNHAITVSRDKLRSLQAMSRHDVGIPPTTFVRQKGEVLPAIERIGGVPVVIKLLEGTQGVGVILAESTKIAEAIIETLQSARQNILIQKFVAESRGTDIRAFVVGGRVVAAMRRRAHGSEFRSNVHRGGSTEAVTLSPEYEQTAIKAAHIMGLNVAGVDMLEGADGPLVMEVNSSPGLEGIEKATGIDVADQVISFIEEQARFENMDFRQRLTLHQGYTVTEIPIKRGSSLHRKTIQETGLRELEVLVLSVDRHGLTIPLPSPDQKLLAGDRLLCYGKKITLRNFLPAQRKRSKKKTSTKKKSS